MRYWHEFKVREPTVKKRAKKQHEENRVKLGNPRLMKRKCPRKERKKVVVERGKNPE